MNIRAGDRGTQRQCGDVAPGIGLADGICDIVSSGSTLLTNGLKEVETVMKSQAVIIANRNISGQKREILEKLLFRIGL